MLDILLAAEITRVREDTQIIMSATHDLTNAKAVSMHISNLNCIQMLTQLNRHIKLFVIPSSTKILVYKVTVLSEFIRKCQQQKIKGASEQLSAHCFFSDIQAVTQKHHTLFILTSITE